MIVIKFGGSSVATAKRIESIAPIISGLQKKHGRLAVVFSAFGGVTDELIRMSRMAASQDENTLMCSIKSVTGISRRLQNLD